MNKPIGTSGMSKEQHIEWLNELKRMCNDSNNLTILSYPKKEGAFYFGEGHDLQSYTERYENQLKKEGLIQ